MFLTLRLNPQGSPHRQPQSPPLCPKITKKKKLRQHSLSRLPLQNQISLLPLVKSIGRSPRTRQPVYEHRLGISEPAISLMRLVR